jgi:hypothetical protein
VTQNADRARTCPRVVGASADGKRMIVCGQPVPCPEHAPPNADYGDTEHAAPYYPPRAEAIEIADLLAAFADRYPHMWPTTRRKMLWAAESLRFQIRRGYVSPNDSLGAPDG